MDPGLQIKSLLQFQLSSDHSAVRNLPYCLSTLSSECLAPSPHLTKWTNRITSLLHAKEPGARWVGFCLAYKTSLLSQNIMINCAQSWVAIVLPALSRNESMPVLKAAIRLLEVIFSTATNVNEFQRQVTVPNVLKLTSALLSLADNRNEPGLKVLCMKSIAHLITLYPTTHRASSTNLMSFCLRYLNGSPTSCINIDVMNAASDLYSILHLTGGKVGSVNLWRRSVDETLVFGWDAFRSLRTTFVSHEQHSRPSLEGGDPQVVIPLNLHRLRNSVVTVSRLLSTLIHRPVHVPIGGLVKFATSLLSCSGEAKIDGFVDPLIHSMEVAIVPEIISIGCNLLNSLARRFSFCLFPHLIRLFTILVMQLEEKPNSYLRLKVLQTLDALLEGSYILDSTPLCGRIAKAVLPSIIRMVTPAPIGLDATANKSKSGKKKRNNFEGEEILKGSYEIICPTPEDREGLLVSIDVLGHLLRYPALSSAMSSIIGRVIVALLITLPRSTVSSLSPDPEFGPALTKRVQQVGLYIGSGTTCVMSKALPFVIEAGICSRESHVLRNLDLLLHPRVPPLVRSMPHLESLSFLKAEESNEEAAALSSLAVAQCSQREEDVAMEDIIPTITAPVEATEQEVSAIWPQKPSEERSHHVNNWNLKQKTLDQSTSPSHPFLSSSTNAAATAPLTSNSREEVRTQVPPAPKPRPLIIPPSQEEEEDMPVINMSSDSEIEEDV